MADSYEQILGNIKIFLEIPPQDSELSRKISAAFSEPEEHLQAAEAVYQFVKYFEMFKTLKALLNIVKEIILSAFDIIESPEDLPETLTKSILLRITEIYIDYSQFPDKEKILKTLSQSLEILAPSAIIINLGLLVKPVFSDPNYIEKQQAEEIFSVEKIDSSDVALKIKADVDHWIKSQMLMVDEQDLLRAQLGKQIEQFAKQYGLSPSAPELNQIKNECIEMLNMQLTVLSLTSELGDDDLSPQPINL